MPFVNLWSKRTQASPLIYRARKTRNLKRGSEGGIALGRMTAAYLNKQQNCCVEMDRGGCGEVPCSCGWQHHPPQGYHYGSVPGGATLPRQRGRLMATRSESSWRSPGPSVVRAKGSSCDLLSECSCPQSQSWRDHYQVTNDVL